MGYAIPRISKLKTDKAMSDSYNHNMRIFHVANADPVLTRLNEELVDQLNGRSYQDMYEDTMRGLYIQGTHAKNPRKDAVRGYEVMLSFSREDAAGMNVEEWAKASVEWLRETFNPPGMQIHYTDRETGEEKTAPIDNVKSVVLHMDEEVPHIHAFIIPIDDRGHLNAYYYTGNRDNLVHMQDSYAKAMEPFGLSRGERHSVATHEQRSRYYSKLLNAVEAELPAVQPGETAEQYRARANEVYRTEQVHHRDAIVKKDQEIVRAKSSVFEDRQMVREERASLQAERQDFDLEKKQMERQIHKLSDAVGEDVGTEAGIRRLRRSVTEHRRFETAVEEHPDRGQSADAARLYHEMVEWQRRREERQRMINRSLE